MTTTPAKTLQAFECRGGGTKGVWICRVEPEASRPKPWETRPLPACLVVARRRRIGVAQLAASGGYMNVPSRITGSLCLLALLASLNGCMTNAAIEHATGTSSRDYPSGSGESIHYDMHYQPHPAYYGLLPLTVPADVATSPIQFGYYLWHRHEQGSYNTHDSR